MLRNCYVNCLKVAEENDCKSIAFPSISTGAYGCPIEKASEIVNDVLRDYNSGIINEVIFILYGEEDFDTYLKKIILT